MENQPQLVGEPQTVSAMTAAQAGEVDPNPITTAIVTGLKTGDSAITQWVVVVIVAPLLLGLLIGVAQKSVGKGLLTLVGTLLFGVYVFPELRGYAEQLKYNEYVKKNGLPHP